MEEKQIDFLNEFRNNTYTTVKIENHVSECILSAKLQQEYRGDVRITNLHQYENGEVDMFIFSTEGKDVENAYKYIEEKYDNFNNFVLSAICHILGLEENSNKIEFSIDKKTFGLIIEVPSKYLDLRI